MSEYSEFMEHIVDIGKPVVHVDITTRGLRYSGPAEFVRQHLSHESYMPAGFEGTIWFEDGSWSEYVTDFDGYTADWEHHVRPEIPASGMWKAGEGPK